MSVIAVRMEASGIQVAVDSQITYGETRVLRGQSLADSKLWVTDGGMLVAFVGSSTMGSVLRRWCMRSVPDGATEAAITDWVDGFHAYREERFKDAGSIDEFGFVLAYGGAAWVIDGYAVSRVMHGGYMAHGSGMEAAMGALYCGATAVQAVAAAIAHHEYCGGAIVAAHLAADGSIAGDAERLESVPVAAEAEQAA